jgi:hypothetical protein
MHPDQPAAPGLTGEQAQQWAAVQPAADDVPILVGDTPERAAVVAGLRALASYLAANPAVPVPPHGWEVLVHAQGTDSQQFSQVDLVSQILGERPADERAGIGHHHVERSFGPVTYRFVGISERRMAQHRAWESYAGSVVPDEHAAQPAELAATAFPARQAAGIPVPARSQPSRRLAGTRRRPEPGMAP